MGNGYGTGSDAFGPGDTQSFDLGNTSRLLNPFFPQTWALPPAKYSPVPAPDATMTMNPPTAATPTTPGMTQADIPPLDPNDPSVRAWKSIVPNQLTGRATQPPQAPGAGTVGDGGYNPPMQAQDEIGRIKSQIARLTAAGDTASAASLQRQLVGMQNQLTNPPPTTATPYTSAPPITGQGQPAPGPDGQAAPATAPAAAPAAAPDSPANITEYDKGRVVKGTNIPVSVAKELIRRYEPGAEGYRASYGLPGNRLPDDVQYDAYGFPVRERSSVANLYGGAYGGGSDASGMYQLLGSTWRGYADKYQMKDALAAGKFSPWQQETLTSNILEREGMNDWVGNAPGKPPWNPRLKAAWEHYQQTGVMPTDEPDPGAGMTITPTTEEAALVRAAPPAGGAAAIPAYTPPGTLHTGDPVPDSGYALGGGGGIGSMVPTVAGVPARGPGEMPQTPIARNLLSPDASPAGAGGPAGDPNQDQRKALMDKFMQGQKQQHGWQMLALLGAMMKGHPITPMNPEVAIRGIPQLTRRAMPIRAPEAPAPLYVNRNWRTPG